MSVIKTRYTVQMWYCFIAKLDKKRANYYGYYTSRKWGRSENYDIMIDTTKIGTEGAARIIEEYVKLLQSK